MNDGQSINDKIFTVSEIEGKIYYQEYNFNTDDPSIKVYDNFMDIINDIPTNDFETSYLMNQAVFLLKEQAIKDGRFKPIEFGDNTIYTFPQLEDLVQLCKEKIYHNKWYEGFTVVDDSAVSTDDVQNIIKDDKERLIIEPITLYINPDQSIELSFMCKFDNNDKYISLDGIEDVTLPINELNGELKKFIDHIMNEMEKRHMGSRPVSISFWTESDWKDFTEHGNFDELESTLYFSNGYQTKIFI